MLSEVERDTALKFFSDFLQVQVADAKEISAEWCLRLLVAAFFPSAPEPVDPLRFLRATAPQLPWPGAAKTADLDQQLLCLLALGVKAEAKDLVIGKMFTQCKEAQHILRRLIHQTETSDENSAPVKPDDKLKREIGNLRRQLDLANAENARLKSEFRKRETLLLQVVHSLGLRLGAQGLSLDSN